MGADVNCVARKIGETTLLLMSLFVGAYTCARYLIDHGAKVKEKNLFDALVIAIKKNKPDYVQLLLDMGANPNLEDKYGDTALMIAIEKRVNTDIIKLLFPKVNERVFNWTRKQISKHYINNYGDVIKVFNEYKKQ